MKHMMKLLVFGALMMAIGAMMTLWIHEGMTASKADQILAKVGNFVITQADLDELMNKLKAFRKDRPYSPEEKKELLEGIVKQVLIMQEAEKLKLDKTPAIDTKLKMAKIEILMKEYVASVIEPKIQVTDKDVEEYISQTPDLIPRETVTLKEIAVKTEPEAKEIINELKKGTNFSTLAGQKSIAPSKIHGGRMGTSMPKGKLPKELEAVAFKLKVGEYSDPIKTENGYTILFLEDKKVRSKKEMDDLMEKVKVRIEQLLKSRKIEEIMEKKVEDLTKATKIEKYYDRIQ